jgi:phage gp16-like protein
MTAAADPTRRVELAAIHVAAKQLAIAEESYRALVSRFTAARTESAGAMTPAERRALLDHFRSIGFAPKGAPAPKRGAARRKDERPQARKLRALWLALWQLGHVHDPSEGALGAFLKRQTGLEALQFADAEALDRAIDALKGWCQRVGYNPVPFRAQLQTPQDGKFAPSLIEAQWKRLGQLAAFKHGVSARLGTWLSRYGASAPQFLGDAQAQRAIDALGRWIRDIAPAEAGDG